MRAQTLLLFCLICSSPLTVSSDCNFITLVKCFIEVLEDWAWTLYELKNNVATISQEKCAHLNQLGKCVKDESDSKHGCTSKEVLTASRTVSDLLTHQQNSGSFLRSYFLLEFPCSAEGQKILETHRECLNNEHIGKLTMNAATYLSQKYIVNGVQNGGMKPEVACTHLKERIDEYNKALAELCEGDASEFMCKSLVKMIKGVYSVETANCDIPCARELDEEKIAPTISQPNPLGQNGPENQNGFAVGKRPSLVQLSVISFGMLFVAYCLRP